MGFTKPLFSLADIKTHTPPAAFPEISQRQGAATASTGAALLTGAVVGAAIGATAMAAKKLNKLDSDKQV